MNGLLNSFDAIDGKRLAQADSLLRAAYSRCRGLPKEDVELAIKICTAYAFRGLPPEVAREALCRIAENFIVEHSQPLRSRGREEIKSCRILDSSLDNSLADLLIIALGKDRSISLSNATDGDILKDLERVKIILQSLRALAPDRMKDASLEDVVGHLSQRLSNIDSALKSAAEEFVDKVLKACDPESAKARIKKGKFELASSYKAALYDSLCEKFSYLREYHENGRLSRDFRTAFRKHQNQE